MDRRIVTGLTLLVLLALVTVGTVWGYTQLTKPAPDPFDADEAPVCEPRAVALGERVATKDVTVSVHNASSRNGLAARTMGLLTDRGFGEGTTGNAPDDATVRGVQIWTEDRRSPAVQLVAAHFRAVKVVRSRALGPGVSVVVGQNFDRLGPGPRAIEAERAAEICSPPTP